MSCSSLKGECDETAVAAVVGSRMAIMKYGWLNGYRLESAKRVEQHKGAEYNAANLPLSLDEHAYCVIDDIQNDCHDQ
jgi:hypothetical protein